MSDNDRTPSRSNLLLTASTTFADALTSGLPTSIVVTSPDGSPIQSGTSIVEARAFELRSARNTSGEADPTRLEVHLVAEKARVPEVEEAIIRLIQVALRDTGQSRIVADFLLSWWNAAEYDSFAVSDLFSLDGALARDIATVVYHLSRCSGAIYADAFGHSDKMATIVARWRGEEIKAA